MPDNRYAQQAGGDLAKLVYAQRSGDDELFLCVGNGGRESGIQRHGCSANDRIEVIMKTIAAIFLWCAGMLAAQTKTYTIDNCVNVFNPANVESTKAGYQYWFAGKDFIDGRTLKMSVVRRGEATHAPHRHPEDEFFFVLEGKAEFYLDGKTKVVGPYTSLYCPSNSEHGIKNAGDSVLKYLVIKKYELK